MACARCPNQRYYQLLWTDRTDPSVICVMMRCCAGPELQLRRAGSTFYSEIFKTPDAVLARADELRDRWSPLGETPAAQPA